MWDADPPEYYDPPGGLMAFRMDYGDLVSSSAPPRDDMQLASFMGHFRLVNHQLVQVRLRTRERHLPWPIDVLDAAASYQFLATARLVSLLGALGLVCR